MVFIYKATGGNIYQSILRIILPYFGDWVDLLLFRDLDLYKHFEAE